MKQANLSEILEHCLDLVLSGQETIDSALAKYPDHAQDLRSELDAALWLQDQRSIIELRPGYIAASRVRLVNQIKQSQVETGTQKKTILAWNRWVFRLVFVALFLILGVFAYRTGAGQVQTSLPGDPLHNLKTSLEELQISRAPGVAAEADLRIELADKRAKEAQSLLSQGRYEDAEVALEGFTKNLSIAADLVSSLQDNTDSKVLLAQKLAATAAESNQSLSAFITTGEIPLDLVAVLNSTITLNDEITLTMMVLVEENDQGFTPEPSPIVPDPSLTPTSTLHPEWSEPTEPSETSESEERTEPSETPKPPDPIDDDDDKVDDKDDDDDDDDVKPTKKPKKTKKPTKTPKK